jgi:aldehyde dehydrogenase (NAD+)
MVTGMPVGNPNDPRTHLGLMVIARQRERVEGYIEISIRQGGRAVAEGLNQGWFVQPTLVIDVDPNSRRAQEEIFGPVLAVLAYDNEDEAVAIASNSQLGLTGTVLSTDVERAISVADRIRTGVVEVNGAPLASARLSAA